MSVSGLITWFTGNEKNRRKYARRPGPFKAWVAAGQNWQTVVCLDISGSGIGVLAQSALGAEVSFRVMLDERPVVIRAKKAWERPGTLQGKPAWRYGLAFTGISADDWDAVVRFAAGGQAAEMENQAQKELDLIKLQPDDVARLIPQKLQEQLLDMLVRAGRLAPLAPGKTPLVQYSYGGVVKRKNGTMHRLSIHSRVVDPLSGQTVAYDTRFYFDDGGGNVSMEN